jgi:hypothetical protein
MNSSIARSTHFKLTESGRHKAAILIVWLRYGKKGSTIVEALKTIGRSEASRGLAKRTRHYFYPKKHWLKL